MFCWRGALSSDFRVWIKNVSGGAFAFAYKSLVHRLCLALSVIVDFLAFLRLGIGFFFCFIVDFS